MKVAIVQEHVAVQRGGAETSTVELAQHLAELGLDVSVVCAAGSAAPGAAHGVRFIAAPADGPSRAWRTYRFVQAAREICRSGSFDIVHAITPCLSAQVYQPRGGTYAETVARSLAPVRSALWRGLKRCARRFNMRQRFLLRLEQTLLGKYSSRVVVAALSDYVRRQVVEGLSFPAARTRVIFNGVDITPPAPAEATELRAALRRNYGWSADTPVLLLAAHNFRLKGLAELLHAAADPTARDWQIVVAGRDNPWPYLRLAARLGLAGRVHFVGTQRPLVHWYVTVDVLAHPTWYDPCSRVVLEAVSLGLPVVTTRYNGASEVLVPGRHGAIIAEPDDAAELTAALQQALQPAVRRACQADAPRLREHLSMRRHARDLATLYEDLLAGRAEAPTGD